MQFECLKPKDKPVAIPSPSANKKFNYADFPEVEKLCRTIIKEEPTNIHAPSTLVQILLAQKTKGSVKEAVELIDNLATKLDVIRENYWKWFRSNVQTDFKDLI